ncbi:MAG: glycosyltransferase [Pseudomonadota bacterium]
MKLVDVCEFFSDFGGGVRTYAHQKLENCAKEGWETTIIAPGPADRREKRLGGEIIWVRSPVLPLDPRYHLFNRARPIHEILDEIKPTVVEGSSTWRGGWIAASWKGEAAKALFLHQDPVAVYPHSLFSPPLNEQRVDQLCFWFWWYLRRLSRHFDATAVSGEWFASRLERFGVKRPIVASFGVNKDLFSYRYRSEGVKRAMLRECGVDDPSALLFIAVSRHHMEKRLSTMMEAFERFAATRPAGLFIIGDGPTRERVEAQAAKTPGVRVAGHIGDRATLARHLASADYMLHGGAAETFGLVVAEALCSGLPIVTPDIGGAADLAHPTYAEVYRPGRPDAMLAAMERMVARDREELAIAARAGANRIPAPADHFKSLLAQYSALYEENERRKAAQRAA